MLKSRLIYLGIILVSFIFSQALYEPVSFMTFVIVLVLPIMSVLLALAVYPLVNAKILVANNFVTRLDEFVIRIILKGICPFISPLVKVTCFVPDKDGLEIKKTIFAVSPSFTSKYYFDHKTTLVNRGKYTVKIVNVEYYDFLKLVKIKKKIKSDININVLPRKIKVDVPVFSKENNQENTNMIGENIVLSGGDMVGVREYVSGDNLKNVHWKLSSKSDDLILKTFAEDVCDRAYIIVDMSCYYQDVNTNRSMTDCVVEISMCAIEEYFRNSVRFSVILPESKYSVKRYPITSPIDKSNTVKEVSFSKNVNGTDIVDMLSGVDFNMISNSEVLIITSFKSSEILKDIKKIFVDKKIKLNVINIVDEDKQDSADIVTYTRDYLENCIKGS